MKISILITSKNHPVLPYLVKWSRQHSGGNQIDIVHSVECIDSGDFLFLISCSDVVSEKVRDRFNQTLVIHASDLPNGRGWSPYIWEITHGATEITVSLIEAEGSVDTGDIWKKIKVHIPKTALIDEINELIFNTELKLMSFAVSNFDIVKPEKQAIEGTSYWSKRTPKDSEIDIHQSLLDQFNLIRVSDSKRFPAFFYIDGQRFDIIIKKNNG